MTKSVSGGMCRFRIEGVPENFCPGLCEILHLCSAIGISKDLSNPSTKLWNILFHKGLLIKRCGERVTYYRGFWCVCVALIVNTSTLRARLDGEPLHQNNDQAEGGDAYHAMVS
jgi:hypothetical protein